ncbi:uncharacterized protein I206_105181 [Kwoniella pini CBS 10737]|uniref:Uncharacterized protein n=1 Tax=Kwoniella pini CBS 10737 TaxID=1296096 RepID=A0A1B9I4Y2_9TREE|nr:uncharacterized protein I206_03910 [Kwoniella pini CBS 10737]OCF50585.1 hypothetical protein I206_03910 [Kwoniella pini CBS 10737]
MFFSTLSPILILLITTISIVSAQETGGVITTIDINIPSWMTMEDYNHGNPTIYGPDHSSINIEEVPSHIKFYVNVYEQTPSPGDDYHTNKDPYWRMACSLIVQNDSRDPSNFALQRTQPWFTGVIAGNIFIECDKNEFICYRDKCEGEYAMPEDSIFINRPV